MTSLQTGEDNGGDRPTLATTPSYSAAGTNQPDMGADPAPQRAVSYTQGGRAVTNAGIRAGEIIGYRAWYVTRDGLLQSMFAEHRWQPGRAEEGDTEWWGIHAFKTSRQAFRSYHCYSIDGPVAFGTVALWGDVVEHEGGFRAQWGAVNSIDKICTTFSPYRVGRRRWEFWKPSLARQLSARYAALNIQQRAGEK
jgi:hypothetical protein